MKKVDNSMILWSVVAILLAFSLFPYIALADSCEHTNVDRYTLPTYEPITGNSEAHKVTIWMQTTCMDCFDLIDETVLTTSEEEHQFQENGSVLICKWCGYQTTTETLQAVATSATETTAELLDTEYTWGDYKYRLYSNGDAEISKGSVRGSITIPTKIDGHRVVSIGSDAFEDCYNLTSIIIPDGVKKIGRGAFDGCAFLTSVTLPCSITSIEEYTFFSCASLTDIIIPESVTSIGRQAFSNCASLRHIILPESRISISDLAFSFCAELTSIRIPANTTIDGADPFWGCSKLADIQVVDSHPTLEIQDGALINKEKKLLICYPAGSEATEYRIPHGISTIGEYSFYGCTALTDVEIPETVTSIEDYAFSECRALRNVSIPESVMSIGYAVFYACPQITIHCNEQIAFHFGALTPAERFADYANIWRDPVQRNLPRGQKVKVYSGPDRSCPVAINGTARLNTNDPFDVWGYHVNWKSQEKWYLVRYQTDYYTSGIGYINENDFFGSIDCTELKFTDVWSIPNGTTFITDDPDGSQRVLITISDDQPYTTYLATYKGMTGDWYYVKYDEYDPPVYGFVPAYYLERLTGW